jgi:catalase
VVHAKGSGAFGSLTVTRDIARYGARVELGLAQRAAR